MAKNKNDVLYLRLLTVISEGVCQAKMPKLLGISRQNLQYYINRLREGGYIEIENKGFTVINRLTEKGKEHLV
jgi:biotin operon repressor